MDQGSRLEYLKSGLEHAVENRCASGMRLVFEAYRIGDLIDPARMTQKQKESVTDILEKLAYCKIPWVMKTLIDRGFAFTRNHDRSESS